MNTVSPADNGIDSEYIILENIYDSVENQLPLRQRDLAQIAGASLGMTNSILKRLAQKGWITVKKLNSRNIRYAVTLEGMNEIIYRSYSYFKRTIKNVVYYKNILEDLIYSAKSRNIKSVFLVGTSDLDFIVEHACGRWGLSFGKINQTKMAEKFSKPHTLIVYAENIPDLSKESAENQTQPSRQNVFYLSKLIIKQAAATKTEFSGKIINGELSL